MQDYDDPEEEEELQALAKHFGKDADELTLEALVKLEQGGPEEEEEQEERGVPRPSYPSLASILGSLPSAATLGLPESIYMAGEKENGEAGSLEQTVAVAFMSVSGVGGRTSWYRSPATPSHPGVLINGLSRETRRPSCLPTAGVKGACGSQTLKPRGLWISAKRVCFCREAAEVQHIEAHANQGHSQVV